MRLLFLTGFLLYNINLFAQLNPSVQEHYDDIFEISKEKYEGKSYISSSVKELPEDHQMAALVNNNKVYLQYWLVNYVDREGYHKLKSIEGEQALQQEFITFLKNDSLFNPLMIRFSERVTNPNFVADTISMDEVLNVAVKYFNILGITEEGYYKGKVCSGLNGISETLATRKPELEAFCFSAILKNLRGDHYNMYNEFVAAIRELYKQELGVEREARLLRAQGAMFSLMRNNVKLKEMLVSEYERKKDFLPFVLHLSDKAKKS